MKYREPFFKMCYRVTRRELALAPIRMKWLWVDIKIGWYSFKLARNESRIEWIKATHPLYDGTPVKDTSQ